MSLTAANYTYEPEHPRPFTGKSFTSPNLLDSRQDSASHDRQDKVNDNDISKPPLPSHSPCTPKSTYHPARADINQSTRKYLGPVKPAWTHESNRILTPELSQGRRFSGSEDSADSKSAESDVQKENLLRAMANLYNNVTLGERSENKMGHNQPEHRPQASDRIGMSGPDGRESLKQVYNMKKPMCLPAVLRPINDDTNLHEEDLHYDLSPELRLPNLKLEENPFELLVRPSNEDNQKTHPTRNHWRPDNLTDHCINCFEQFATFFYPQRKRRHHCRFCGYIFCHNCLYKNRDLASFEISPPSQDSKEKKWSRANSGSSNGSSVTSATTIISSITPDEFESGLMLDANARFVVPMFKNLVHQNISMGELQNKFHTCKVCKLCGNNYQRLLYLFNQKNRHEGNIDAPYVFIENPYTGIEGLMSSSTELRPLIDTSIEARTYDEQRRHSSVTNSVPSDWTWSSF